MASELSQIFFTSMLDSQIILIFVFQMYPNHAQVPWTYSPGKVGFYPPLIAKETKPTALRALVCI